MDEHTFQALYSKAMKGSLHDLVALANIEPANPYYDSQIDKVFNVLHYRLNLQRSLNYSREQLQSFMACRVCLSNLDSKDDGDKVSVTLSAGFARVWPSIWKFIGSVCIPGLKQYSLPAAARRCVTGEISAMCCVLGRDDPMMLNMISTPGFCSLVLEIWSMEVDHPDHQPWDEEMYQSIAVFLDRAFSFLAKPGDTRGLEQFLAPLNGDMKYLSSTALKHLHHAFYRKQPNFDCVIWNTHIITVLSGMCDPIRNAFLAQHTIPAVTKILVSITADMPSPATASLKAKAMQFAFWNLVVLIESTDGVTWVIQALEAKLMFALLQCEPWLPYQDDNPEIFLYPYLKILLPNYSAHRSVLCVMEKYLTKIQYLGLEAGKSKDTPLWKAWNTFVELAESRMEILRLAPGGVLRAHERCHNAKCSKDHVHGEFRQCAACLSARYCSKSCQTYDWKFGGHRQFCKELEAQRREGHIPDMPKGVFDFIGAMIEAERVRIQDGLPHIFGSIKTRLLVLLLDFLVCPPTKNLIPPENFNFCEHSYSKPLLARWDQLRKDMNTLPHPTLLFCVRVQRGSTTVPIFRVVTAISNEELGELVLHKGVGRSC